MQNRLGPAPLAPAAAEDYRNCCPFPGLKESIMRWMMLSLAAGAMILAGCASTTTPYQSNIDFEKVARIENAAKAFGVSVYWVNYPQKTSSSVN